MSQERLTEWLEVTRDEIPAYHTTQFAAPKESTKAFAAALQRRGLLSPGSSVLDLACGAGAATGYLAAAHPEVTFTGLDINADLIAYSRHALASCPNLRLEVGDLYALDEARSWPGPDGVTMLQTLCWLPDAAAALGAVARLRPRWLACSSLFHDGPVTHITQVHDHTKATTGAPHVDTYYNVYSLRRIEELLWAGGFREVDSEPFELEIDLPRPADGGMGTYTERLADGRRLSVSGPHFMPWRFVFAVR
jgi:SAM-dependent methyltransferase